jgi:hypothetical protein
MQAKQWSASAEPWSAELDASEASIDAARNGEHPRNGEHQREPKDSERGDSEREARGVAAAPNREGGAPKYTSILLLPL